MNIKLITTAIALALGVVWTAGPALAQQTTGEKAESKTERAKEKAVEAKDTVKEKAVEAKDTVKEKARDVKEKIKEKTSGLREKATARMERMEAKAEKRDVEAMQRALKDRGHDPGPIDGIFGPRTRAALTDFQKKEGLTVTGRWDDETASRLGVRMSSMPDRAAGAASPAAPTGDPTGSSAPAALPSPSEERDKAPATKRQNP